LLSNKDKGVTTQHLVALALRFRPDRIFVGEVRFGEAFDMLQALNTGHDGGMASFTPAARARSLPTGEHGFARHSTGSGWKLDDMRKLIADCIHYVVHMKRTGEMRHVSEIIEIKGFRDNDYDIKRVF
jgi:Flp pilus assembly CpaF family ATPase